MALVVVRIAKVFAIVRHGDAAGERQQHGQQ